MWIIRQREEERRAEQRQQSGMKSGEGPEVRRIHVNTFKAECLAMIQEVVGELSENGDDTEVGEGKGGEPNQSPSHRDQEGSAASEVDVSEVDLDTANVSTLMSLVKKESKLLDMQFRDRHTCDYIESDLRKAAKRGACTSKDPYDPFRDTNRSARHCVTAQKTISRAGQKTRRKKTEASKVGIEAKKQCFRRMEFGNLNILKYVICTSGLINRACDSRSIFNQES